MSFASINKGLLGQHLQFPIRWSHWKDHCRVKIRILLQALIRMGELSIMGALTRRGTLLGRRVQNWIIMSSHLHGFAQTITSAKRSFKVSANLITTVTVFFLFKETKLGNYLQVLSLFPQFFKIGLWNSKVISLYNKKIQDAIIIIKYTSYNEKFSWHKSECNVIVCWILSHLHTL